jgi:hypothetical protein
VGLWVHSYFRDDQICWGFTERSGLALFSGRGRLLVDWVTMGGDLYISKWYAASDPSGFGLWWLPREQFNTAVSGFYFRFYWSGNFFVTLPYWFLLLATATGVAVLKFKRFSLRGLFVFVTLFAVLFGLSARFKPEPYRDWSAELRNSQAKML